MLTTISNVLSQPWVGTVLGLASLAAAIYFYLKSRKRSQLAYQRREVAIVGGGTTAFPSDVEIRYASHVVPRVTSSRFAIWNSGTETIDPHQFVESDKIRLQVSEGERILRADVVKTSRTVNDFRLEFSSDAPSSAVIIFDFLDPGDGALVDVVHTDARGSINITGTLRGLPKGLTDLGELVLVPKDPKKLRARRIKVTALFLAIGAFLMIGGLFGHTIDKTLGTDLSVEALRHWMGAVITLMGAFILSIPFIAMYMFRIRYPIVLAKVDSDSDSETTVEAVSSDGA
jgi:hypothetical protein